MKNTFLYIMSLVYVVAGINHFINPGFYIKIMPSYIPWHSFLVFISGVCEVALALLLLPLATRATAAWLLILLLLAVFPANVQMAVTYYKTNNPYLWVAILRLPLQIPLILWAWQYTK